MHKLSDFSEKTFRPFFYEHFTGVCLFAEQLLGHKELARNVARTAFLTLWNELAAGEAVYPSYAQAKSRIYRLAADSCIPHLAGREDKGTLEWLYRDDETLWLAVYEKELENLAFSALTGLSRKARTLALLAFAGMPEAEIAARLHWSPAKVSRQRQKVFRRIDREIKVFQIGQIQQVHLT